MTPLQWFRFEASFREIGQYLLAMVALSITTSFIARAIDDDGDGYDDYTGEYIGYDDGTGSYDDGTGSYDDGTGSYDDGTGSYDDGSGSYDDGSGSYDDGSGSYDDGSGSYDDGSGSYDDGTGTSSSDWDDDDSDGLYNIEESDYGTDPSDPDTDGDGLWDGEEIYGLDWYYEESYDYISHYEYEYDDSTGDYIEVPVYETQTEYYQSYIYTDPNDPDSDNDKLPDGYEYDIGLNPSDPADGNADIDNDGLTRGDEFELTTSYNNPDSDNDSYDDGTEVLVMGTDPQNPNDPPVESGDTSNSDSDSGTSDTSDSSGTGSSGTDDATDPGDSTPTDDTTTNSDPDPLPTTTFSFGSKELSFPDYPNLPDINAGDEDGDGIEDTWEFKWFGGRLAVVPTDDFDSDGLTALQEFQNDTNPLVPDTDSDGLNDGDELTAGTNPLSKDSDNDKYPDGWEVDNGLDPNLPLVQEPDSDGDRIPDSYESFHGIADQEIFLLEDQDLDQLTLGSNALDSINVTTGDDGSIIELSEFLHGTRPDLSDTDGDGLDDYYEIMPRLVTVVLGSDWTWDGVQWQYYEYTEQQYRTTDPTSNDSDDDGYSDGLEDSFGTDPLSADSYPSDQAPNVDTESNDDWISYFANSALLDTDGDGLSDDDEINRFFTEPGVIDTDDDGFTDFEEIYYYYTDPLDKFDFWVDADSDGLRDDWELKNNLNSDSSDTDGDFISDWLEVFHGSDASEIDTLDEDQDGLLDLWESIYNLDDPNEDWDADGLTNLEEYLNETNPYLDDTDGDWLIDGFEVNRYGTNPLLFDTDGDGVGDGIELEWHLTDPTSSDSVEIDTDQDGIPDDWEAANGMNPAELDDFDIDTDMDGLPNYLEYWLRTDPGDPNSQSPDSTDGELWENGDLTFSSRVAESDFDFDGDGLSDQYELEHNLDIFNADADADSDEDGFTNMEEFTQGTHPNEEDTDFDGLLDNVELIEGVTVSTFDILSGTIAEQTFHTNPLEPDSDFDGFTDHEELVTGVVLLATGETVYLNPMSNDTDGDGIGDFTEWSIGFNPVDPSDGAADLDDDGLSNADELARGTDIDDVDSDGDNLFDGWEVANGYNPTLNEAAGSVDRDGDGLSDLLEFVLGFDIDTPDTYERGTSGMIDVFDVDSDNDGMADFWEDFFGFLGYNSNDDTDQALLDQDGDGLPDWWEYWNGDSIVSIAADGDLDNDGVSNLDEFNASTDPHEADTDSDGLTDSEEAAINTSPFRRDTDGDGLTDLVESQPQEIVVHQISYGLYGEETFEYDENGAQVSVRPWVGFDTIADYQSWRANVAADGYYYYDEAGNVVVDPYSGSDYDSTYTGDSTSYDDTYYTDDGSYSDDSAYYDGSSDYPEDSTTDSTSTTEPTPPVYNDYVERSESLTLTVTTDPTYFDTDDDLLPDGYEILHSLNPVDAVDGDADSDGDLLTRGEEYVLGTDYTKEDTDGDSYHDGIEVLLGTNPLDPNDPGPDDEPQEPQNPTKAEVKTVFGTTDTDGDGVYDVIEIKNHTDPKDPNSKIPAGDGDEDCSAFN